MYNIIIRLLVTLLASALASCTVITGSIKDSEYQKIRNFVREELKNDYPFTTDRDVRNASSVGLLSCYDATSVFGYTADQNREYSSKQLVRYEFMNQAFIFLEAESALIQAGYPKSEVRKWIDKVENQYFDKNANRPLIKNFSTQTITNLANYEEFFLTLITFAADYNKSKNSSLPQANIGGECGGGGISVRFQSDVSGVAFIIPEGDFIICQDIDGVNPYSMVDCPYWDEVPRYSIHDIDDGDSLDLAGQYRYQIRGDDREVLIGGPFNTWLFDNPRSLYAVVPLKGQPLI